MLVVCAIVVSVVVLATVVLVALAIDGVEQHNHLPHLDH